MPDGPGEIGEALTHLEVSPLLVRDALEQEVGPERCSYESHPIHRDRASVEQRHAMLETLSGEFASRYVNLRAVELVVPGNVENPVGAGPLRGDVANVAVEHRGEVACEDDEFGVGSERRDAVTRKIDVEV